MSLSVDLVFRLLEEKKFGEYKDKIRPEFLDSSGLKLYEFIDSFHKKYETLPTIALVSEEFGLQKSEDKGIDVPLEYIIDELKKKYDIDQFVNLSVKLEKQVSQGLVEDAKEEVKTFIKDMNERDVLGSSSVSLFSLAPKVIESYQDAKDGKLGIPTPWKWLDSWTLGWYPSDVSFIAARPSVGKSLSPETKILMYDGSVKMVKDVRVGEQVMGPDSKPRNVMGVHFGKEEMFEIIPNKGDKWVCNRSHILSLKMSSDNGNVYKKGQIFNLSIDEYLSKNNKFKHHAKLWRTAIDFKRRKVRDDPHTLGYYLFEKTIPREYLINDREVRLNILAGIIDSYRGKPISRSARYDVISEYSELTEDILFLARSLGFFAEIVKDKYAGKVCDRILISGDIHKIPCTLKGKKFRTKKQTKNHLLSGFKIKSIGEGPYCGIELDGDHLYLLADFTVTHNTWMAIMIALAAWKNGARVLFSSAEMSEQDIARRAFSLYSKMNYSQIRKGSIPAYHEPTFFSKVEDFSKEFGFEIMDPKVSSRMSAIEAAIARTVPDFIVIDACYAVKSSYKSRDRLDNVAMVAQEMKDIAMRYKVSILGTTQLNRDSTKKKTHGTEDLAMSDVLGFVGSNVLMLSQTEEEAANKHLRISPLKVREMENARSSMIIHWDISNHKFDEVSASEISGETKARPSYMDIEPPADDEIF